MLSQPRLYRLMVLLLALGLLLVACERPVPGGDGTEEETTTETGEGTEGETAGGGETGEADVGVGAGTTDDTSETEGASGEDTTPRVDEAEEEPAVTEETEESKPGEKEETAEGTEGATADAGGETVEVAPTAEPVAEEVTEDAAAAAPTTHTVAAGENLYRIGLRYNVSWVALAELNNLSNANQIRVGQVLTLPGESQPAMEPTPSPLTETTYTVKSGDNLYRIGLLYGIGWIQIAEANGLVNPNQIIVGQVLKIPVDTPGPAPQFTHQVRANETLFLISLQYGVSWPAIAEANNISSPYVIFPGQTLVIPGG